MSPILTTVFVTPKITLLYGAQGGNTGPLQIVNLDSSNTVYLSTQANPSPNQPGTFPLLPLSSLAFDGTTAIYAITLTGNVIAGIVPGGEGYSPGALAITGPVTATISGPVTVNGSVGITGTPSVNVANTPSVNVSGTPNVNIANTPAVTVSSGSVAVSSVSGTIDVSGSSVDITTGNVNATGVGGFILPGDVATLYSSTTNQAISPGTTLFPILLQDVTNYNTYDISVSVNDSSQATLNHAHAYRIILQWFDDLVSGIPVFQEVWCPWVGNAANAVPATGTGPMHGKYMTVAIEGYSASTGNITMNSCLIFGSGRVTNLSEWRQNMVNTMADQNAHIVVNNSSGFDNMICDTGGMVTLSASTNYILPFNLYSGPMDFAVQWGANIVISRSNIINIGSNQGQTSGNLNPQANSLEIVPTGAGTNFAGSQLLPRAACGYFIGVGATGGTMEFTAVAQQGP